MHIHLALDYVAEGKNKSQCEVFNLGTGNGVTVLEAIKAFEKISGVKLNYDDRTKKTGRCNMPFMPTMILQEKH